MTSQLACRILGMIISIWLARYLGDAEFGRYTFIITILGFARAASYFGMDQVLIRSVAKNKEYTRLLIGSGIVVRSIIFVIGFIPLLIFILLLHKPMDMKIAFFVGYFSVLFVIVNQTFESIFNGHERMGIPAIMQFVSKIFQIGLILIVVKLRLGLLWILGTFVASEMLRSVFLFGITTASWGWPHSTKNMIFDITRQSITFVGIRLISMVKTRSDILLLGLWCKDEVVGWYGAAINLTMAFLIISSSLGDALFPVFSRLTDKLHRGNLVEINHRSLKILLVAGLPIALSLTLLAPRVIALLYPESYHRASIVLAITIWMVPVEFINAAIIRILYAFHQEKYLFYIDSLCMLLSITLNVILIRLFAHTGAAITSLVIFILTFVLCILLVEKKVTHLKYPFGTLLRLLPALLALTTVILYLKTFSLTILVILGVLIYSLFVLVFKAISLGEIVSMIQMFLPGARGKRES
jgi:O-antigen/teichoic acid export membrane protein